MTINKSIRQKVVDILNVLFGDENGESIFFIENTTKRTGGYNVPKEDFSKTMSWSAMSDGKNPKWVICVGMTMTEFVKEYKTNNCLYTTETDLNIPRITIYRKNNANIY